MSLSDILSSFPVDSEEPAETDSAEQGQQEAAGDMFKCGVCGGDRWWLLIGTDQWKCYECTPPPSRSFVASERNGDIVESEELEDEPEELETVISRVIFVAPEQIQRVRFVRFGRKIEYDKVVDCCENCQCNLQEELAYSTGRIESVCWACRLPWTTKHIEQK